MTNTLEERFEKRFKGSPIWSMPIVISIEAFIKEEIYLAKKEVEEMLSEDKYDKNY